MERNLYASLKKWNQQPERMPLLLRGARQVGKIHLVSTFGEQEFKKLVYINF